MFRSSFLIYSRRIDADEVVPQLRARLLALKARCPIRAGRVDRDKARRWGVRPLPPADLAYVAIDLCSIHASHPHLNRMEERLRVVLPECERAGLFAADVKGDAVLDITASNGHETDRFVRTIAFRPELLKLLARYPIRVRIDAVPSGDP